MSEIENLEREIAALENARAVLPNSQEIASALEYRMHERARLAELRAKEVDPLLIEARVIAAKCKRDIVGASTVVDSIAAGKWDNHQLVVCARAALRRGMELAALPLAPVAPMSEEEIEGRAKAVVYEAYEAGDTSPVGVATIAIRETLRRAPNWPSEGELREIAKAASKQGFLSHYSTALEMARRLKAWQTGESQ